MTPVTVGTADYSLRNRGPWTVVSIEEWDGVCLGQTTAIGEITPPTFERVEPRNKFYSLFSVRRVHEADQVHGAGLRDVPPYSSGQLQCDGLTTARSAVMLTMRTADCYPVFLRSKADRRIGILHAGWRGLREGIVHKSLDSWFEGPVSVLIGAGIGQKRYEVSNDVVEDIARSHHTSPSSLREDGILVDDHLDLAGLVRIQCEEASVSVETFRKLSLKTGEETPVPMYSYRKDGTDHRMISWIYSRPN